MSRSLFQLLALICFSLSLDVTCWHKIWTLRFVGHGASASRSRSGIPWKQTYRKAQCYSFGIRRHQERTNNNCYGQNSRDPCSHWSSGSYSDTDHTHIHVFMISKLLILNIWFWCCVLQLLIEDKIKTRGVLRPLEPEVYLPGKS